MLHIQYFTPLGLVQLVCSPFLSSIMVTFPFLLTKFDGFAIIWVDKETAFLLWVKGYALFRYPQVPCSRMVSTEVAVLP